MAGSLLQLIGVGVMHGRVGFGMPLRHQTGKARLGSESRRMVLRLTKWWMVVPAAEIKPERLLRLHTMNRAYQVKKRWCRCLKACCIFTHVRLFIIQRISCSLSLGLTCL